MNIRSGALPPSPPASVSRSSTGTTAHPMSISSSSGGRKYSTQVFEEQLLQHHAALRDFLVGVLRDDQSYQPHHRARDKLLRLSAVQFQELSTDVYDELLRREDERQVEGPGQSNQVPRFLLPKNNFHPKRNQARQKLSTLPVKKFRELATDVLYELERRYPRFGGADIERMASPAGSMGSPRSRPSTSNGLPPLSLRRPSATGSAGPYSPGLLDQHTPNSISSMEYSRLQPKTYQSNTIVPNKSTMVEDDESQMGEEDDDFYDGTQLSRRATNKSLPYSVREERAPNEYQAEISRLEYKIDELESTLRDKDDELRQTQSSAKEGQQSIELEKARSSNLKADLERQLATAQNLNSTLQIELENLRASNSSIQNDLLQASSISGRDGGTEWKARYETLEKHLEEQQQITDEVRHEATQSLREMRMLSERSIQATEGEEKLLKQVNQLEATVDEWKSRYARTRTQLRSLRASSIGLHSHQTSTAKQIVRDGNFTDADGLVEDVHVTKFQIAIDELLHLARTGEPAAVLDYMRTIVGCVKNVTHDVDQAQTSNNEELMKNRLKLKAKVSSTANNLITTAKNFSASSGLSPVSLLDAAASHLTNAVVDLLRTVKIRPTPAGELEDDDDILPPASSGSGYYPFHSRSRSDVQSSASMTSSLGSSMRLTNGWSGGATYGKSASQGANGFMSHFRSKSTGASQPAFHNSSGGALKEYLEDQTAALVNSIQPFIQNIRATGAGDAGSLTSINTRVSEIAETVGDVIQRINTTADDERSELASALYKHAFPIVQELEQCRESLLSAQQSMGDIQDEEDRKAMVKEQMPPLAFRIVRCTKTLLSRVDDIESGHIMAADPVAAM